MTFYFCSITVEKREEKKILILKKSKNRSAV